MTRVVFAGLLAVVALAPLPFASNRPWSWGLLSLTVGGAYYDADRVVVGTLAL